MCEIAWNYCIKLWCVYECVWCAFDKHDEFTYKEENLDRFVYIKDTQSRIIFS